MINSRQLSYCGRIIKIETEGYYFHGEIFRGGLWGNRSIAVYNKQNKYDGILNLDKEEYNSPYHLIAEPVFSFSNS